MPMGCSSSCKTFELFSTAIEWIAQNKLHIPHIWHLLDDFLIISPSEELCQKQLDTFCVFVTIWVFLWHQRKQLAHQQIFSFAGIELDTVKLEARLPPEKLDKCRDLISACLRRRKVTLQEIQSLTGLLNFGCTVVVLRRAFLRRLIDLTIGVKKPHFCIRLSKAVKDDLLIWQRFLSGCNGRSFFLSSSGLILTYLTYILMPLVLWVCGLFGKHWCYGQWLDSWRHRNIAFLELFLIVLSLHLWGCEMQNQRILFFTDNQALVHVINKQSCRDKDLMFLVRRLVLVCLADNISFKTKHIPGTYLHESTSHGDTSSASSAQLASVASFLLHSNLQPSSIPTHKRAWKLFYKFCNSVFHLPFLSLPISHTVMALFIAFLYNSHYAPSTVTTYISALGYSHKFLGFSDPSKVFFMLLKF